jgi:hypothetical protein
MKLETVESDVIHAIGYDDDVNVLEIIFNTGQIYQYRNVPREVFEQLLRAESKGSYFQNNIRDEFEYWQWDVPMAKFIRGEQKAARSANESEDLRGATE